MITRGAGCGLQGLGCLLLFPGLFLLLILIPALRAADFREAFVPGLIGLALVAGALVLLAIGRRAITAPERIELILRDER